MTQAEKKMKNYVNAVERRLNLPREIKARVMSDFQSSIVARREAGQTDEEIYAELGTPAKAAADLNEQMKDYAYRKSPWRFLFLGIAAIGGVRLLYDRERMDAVLLAIPSLTVEEERNWNRRYRENMARLKSGDLTEVARVVKSLMRREAARGLSTGERKMLHSAKEILLSELAMVREIGYQEAERLLDGAVMTGACE